MMLAYLQSRKRWKDKADDLGCDVSDDALLLLQYIADDLGWTEHGGSVGAAWLTDEGEVALVNLAAAAERGE